MERTRDTLNTYISFNEDKAPVPASHSPSYLNPHCSKQACRDSYVRKKLTAIHFEPFPSINLYKLKQDIGDIDQEVDTARGQCRRVLMKDWLGLHG